MPESAIIVEQLGRVTRIAFDREPSLEELTTPRIQSDLVPLLDGPDQRRLLVDCSGLTFISSRGLGMMVTLYRKAAMNGSIIVLTRLPAPIARIFELTSLDRMFKIFPNNDAAIQFLESA